MNLAQGKRKQAGRKTAAQPVTAHPLFPAIVALWFGALFGLGSLAIRPALLEALVLKLHLDLVIPAAAPPLGMTARILLSIGLALAGGCLGALVARRIARPRPEVRERRRAAGLAMNRARQSDMDDAPSARRRSLAVEEDYRPTYHHEYAPLPGGAPQILDVSEFDFAQEDAAPARVAPEPAPFADETPATAPIAAGALDLSGFLAGEPPVAGPAVQDAMQPEAQPVPPVAEDRPQPAFAAPARSFDMPVEAPVLARFAAPAAEAAPPFAPAPADFTASPFGAPFGAPFAAPAQPEAAPPVVEAPAIAPQVFAAPAFAAPEVQPCPTPEPAVVATDDRVDEDETVDQIHAAALEALSQVELIERLARALQRRRALAGSTAPAAYAATALTEPASPEPAGQEPSPAAAAPSWTSSDEAEATVEPILDLSGMAAPAPAPAPCRVRLS